MKLHVDLETLQLIEGPGFRNPITALRFKRGDAAQLEVTFLEGGSTAASIGNPLALEIHFGIKPRNRYDIGYLVHDSVWTMPANDAEAPVYRCSPSFNTLELDSALGVGSSTGTELSEITLMGEITWRVGDGQPTSTRTFLVVVENDVNRGTEGVPSPAAPAYPAATSIELITRKGQPNGYAELDQHGHIPSQRIHGTSLPDFIEMTWRKGQAHGYAGLDAHGLIPLVHLPSGSGGGHGESTPYVNVDTYGVAIGHGTSINGTATKVGSAASGYGVSVGYYAATPHGEAVAVGTYSQAAIHGVAVGNWARTYRQSCIAIGAYAEAGGGWNAHGIAQLEIASFGAGGPRISGHINPSTGIPAMQFSVTLDHGSSDLAPIPDWTTSFSVNPGMLQPGMMTFGYNAMTGNLSVHVNCAGSIRTAILPMT